MKYYHSSFTTRRLVWIYVSEHPQAPIREIAEAIGISYSVVAVRLRDLREMGYIEFDSKMQQARRIIVPFRMIA